LNSAWARALFPFLFLGATAILYFSTTGIVFIRFSKFMPLFGFGMVAYWCMRNETVQKRLKGNLVGLAAVILTLTGLIVAVEPNVISMPLFAFAFIAIACGNGIFGILQLKSSIILGECSFGIYVIHGIILDVFFVDGDPFVRHIPTAYLPLFIPLLAVVLVFVAGLLHIAIERPALNYGHRLSKKIAKRYRSVPGQTPPDIPARAAKSPKVALES
jgi:peptidoglycan/LPS O-acetylase OafA/YrhL